MKLILSGLTVLLMIAGCSTGDGSEDASGDQDTVGQDSKGTADGWDDDGFPPDDATEMTAGDGVAPTDVPGEEALPPPCVEDAECNDLDPCTIDKCEAGFGCLNTPKLCSDDNQCTIDICRPADGKCEHETIECEDDNECTEEACDHELGCLFSALDCDDGLACTADGCNPVSGCSNKPRTCDDGNPCTDDSCTEPGGCSHNPSGDPNCCVADFQCDDELPCTLDACSAYSCTHEPIVGLTCCELDTDCADDNECTENLCIEGLCQLFAAGPGCCMEEGDCSDGDGCTVDSCLDYFCQFEPVEGCCHDDTECDDDDVCTEDGCGIVGGDFGFCENAVTPGCCHGEDIECDDGNPCTTDICPGEGDICLHEWVANCCLTIQDCDDTQACTVDSCVENQCTHQDICCSADAECDDDDICTTDLCAMQEEEIGFCENQPIPDCCHGEDAECNDGNLCTLDACPGEGEICTHEWQDNCCLNVNDCDDEEPCTVDSCTANQCEHEDVCCFKDVDCADGDLCTEDLCGLVDGNYGFCQNPPIIDCCHGEDAECNDGNLCTIDSCPGDGEVCLHEWKKECCLNFDDCDDQDPCTIDSCVDNFCGHLDVCCDSDAECDDGDDICTNESCVDDFCVYEATGEPGCCNTPLFEDDFLTDKGWEFGPNWERAPAEASGGQAYGNPDPSQDHTGSEDNFLAGVVVGGNAPTDEHDFYYLTSPPINAATAQTLTLTFWRWLNSDYEPYMTNIIEAFDGSNWTELWKTASSPGVQDFDWAYQEFDVTPFANAQFRVRFGYKIGSAGVFSVAQWNLDDVRIFEGSGDLCCQWDSDCQTPENPEAICLAGKCFAGECTMAAQCNDNNDCTIDTCEEGECVNETIPDC